MYDNTWFFFWEGGAGSNPPWISNGSLWWNTTGTGRMTFLEVMLQHTLVYTPTILQNFGLRQGAFVGQWCGTLPLTLLYASDTVIPTKNFTTMRQPQHKQQRPPRRTPRQIATPQNTVHHTNTYTIHHRGNPTTPHTTPPHRPEHTVRYFFLL